MPGYDFSEFHAACAMPPLIFVKPDAQADATRCFNLSTKAEACSFITLNDYEFFEHINTLPLEHKPKNIVDDVSVDAYSFVDGSKIGYLAFYKVPGRTIWTIKSLHLSLSSPLSHSPFQLLATLMEK